MTDERKEKTRERRRDNLKDNLADAPVRGGIEVTEGRAKEVGFVVQAGLALLGLRDHLAVAGRLHRVFHLVVALKKKKKKKRSEKKKEEEKDQQKDRFHAHGSLP